MFKSVASANQSVWYERVYDAVQFVRKNGYNLVAESGDQVRPLWIANFRQNCHLKFESKVERRFRTKKGNGGLATIPSKIPNQFFCKVFKNSKILFLLFLIISP